MSEKPGGNIFRELRKGAAAEAGGEATGGTLEEAFSSVSRTVRAAGASASLT